jgi:hypothetical protein
MYSSSFMQNILWYILQENNNCYSVNRVTFLMVLFMCVVCKNEQILLDVYQ